MGNDIKFREKVMSYVSKGHTIREAASTLDISTTTIMGWKKLKAETGSLEKQELTRKTAKICSYKLLAYITENPDSYLREIAEEFNCTEQAIFYALKRLKITRKKSSNICGKLLGKGR